jgi:hypothetical protein
MRSRGRRHEDIRHRYQRGSAPKTVCAEGGGFILPAIALWTIGAAHVIAGVPMIVVGALPPKQPAAATGPGVAPSAAPAPRTFGLGWTF